MLVSVCLDPERNQQQMAAQPSTVNHQHLLVLFSGVKRREFILVLQLVCVRGMMVVMMTRCILNARVAVIVCITVEEAPLAICFVDYEAFPRISSARVFCLLLVPPHQNENQSDPSLVVNICNLVAEETPQCRNVEFAAILGPLPQCTI